MTPSARSGQRAALTEDTLRARPTHAAPNCGAAASGVVWLSALALAASPAWAQYGGEVTAPSGAVTGPAGTSTGPVDPFGTRDLIPLGKPGWSLHPMVSVEETYTDNVRLAREGAERADWVTQLRPSISVDGVTARTRLRASYSPRLIYRANEGTRDVYHYLNASGNAELLQQLFFVDARASISQQNLSALGPQAQSDVNNTGNRTQLSTYSMSPYLRHAFGYEALGELRYTHNAVKYSGRSPLNSTSNALDMNVVSGPAYRLLTWNAAYHREDIDYDNSGQKVELESVHAGARRLITPTVGILAKVGYDDNNYTTFGKAPRGAFWEAGPEWTPTPRTHLSATAGHRYFGSTRSLDFRHRTRLTAWTLTYNEGIATSRGQAAIPATGDTASMLDTLFRSTIQDPAARATAVQNYIDQTGLPDTLTVPLNFATLVPFLQKRLQASVGVHGVRNNVLASVFSQTREATATGVPFAGDFTGTRDTKQTGGSIIWTSRLTAQTSSSVSAGYTRSTFPGLAREDKLTYLRAGLTKQFQPRVSGSVNVRRLQNDSNQSGGGYRENAITVALSIRF